MQNLIDTSTAFYGAGNTPTGKLFTITSGVYSGRQIVVYSASPSTIKFSCADPPYADWSTPQTIATNAADYPVAATMDSDGNVYIAFTAETTLDLLFRKLSFSAGVWTVGAEATIYNDKDNYFPSILKDVSGKLWVSWTCYDSATGNYTLHAKTSVVEGTLWGAGSADPGEALTVGSSGCYGCFVYLQPWVYCIYTDGGAKLAYRRIPNGGVFWESEVTIYTGTSLSDAFSARCSESGSLIGVAVNAGAKTWYIEYDGANWSASYEIGADPVIAPLLMFNGATPYVIFGTSLGDGQTELRYRRKNGVGFEPAVDLNGEFVRFKYVLLYDTNGIPDYQGLTAEAASSAVADVRHLDSTKLIQSVGDAICLGADDKFSACNFILSTAGDAGGAVTWAYFDGATWQEFTPQSGAYHFDQLTQRVRLWIDSASAPADWQKTAIIGLNAYWIKVIVTSAFTTAPIGSQITPLPEINFLNN